MIWVKVQSKKKNTKFFFVGIFQDYSLTPGISDMFSSVLIDINRFLIGKLTWKLLQPQSMVLPKKIGVASQATLASAMKINTLDEDSW